MAAVDRADPANTNVYLGNISPETNEDDLMRHFAGMTILVYCHTILDLLNTSYNE